MNPQGFGQVPGGPPSPSTSSQLIGSTPLTAPPAPGPTPDQIVSGYMDQVRNLHLTIDALAQQFPAAAPDLQTAKAALVSSMTKVASSMAQPEQSPGPQTF